jgi:hypothetical protein
MLTGGMDVTAPSLAITTDPNRVMFQPQRPTFISSFLANLPSALSAGVNASMRPGGGLATGLAGGFEGVEGHNVLMQQMQRNNLENQMIQAQIQAIPMQRQLQIAQLHREQAQTRQAQFVTPRSGGVYDLSTEQFAPGAEPPLRPETVQQGLAQAVTNARAAGKDPSQDPDTNAWLTIAQSIANPHQDNPFTLWQQQHPGAPVEQWVALNRQKSENPSAIDSRLDHSYQFSSSQLDKLQTPIDQTVQRISRLQDTLNQNNPQADALVAPELLSVMAGGQGSGLRMNEAEISRIVGGRSNWQSLQAYANKWATDPSAARSITPAQQQQIRALVSAVSAKLGAKSSTLNQARQELIDATDVVGHRRAVLKARNALNQIDSGGASRPSLPTERTVQ